MREKVLSHTSSSLPRCGTVNVSQTRPSCDEYRVNGRITSVSNVTENPTSWRSTLNSHAATSPCALAGKVMTWRDPRLSSSCWLTADCSIMAAIGDREADAGMEAPRNNSTNSALRATSGMATSSVRKRCRAACF